MNTEYAIYIVVEGYSEERFVKDVLAKYLLSILSLSYVEKGGLCTQKYTIGISIDRNIESLRYRCIAIIATIVPRMCFIR